MMHSNRWRVAVFFLVIFGMGLLAGNVIAKEVIFLDLSDYTGPVAGLALPGSMGTQDYLKYINAKGGVDGLMIKYMGVDTRYDVARAISAFKRQRRNPKVVAVGIVSTPVGKMLQALLLLLGIHLLPDLILILGIILIYYGLKGLILFLFHRQEVVAEEQGLILL